MTTLPNTGMTLPVRGAPGAGLWGDTMDANLAIIDAMDHTPGHGPLIPTAGLNINADLSFSSAWAPKNLHRLQFSEIAGAALTGSNNLSLFVSDGTGGLTAHELYFRTSAGNNIKFTSGSSLNFAAFVGGIGGDYTSVGAQLNYDDAGKRYTFKEGTGDSNGWARLAAGSLRLIEFGTTETLYVEQLAPAALASSYAMTWPVALPAAAQTVSVDNSGTIAFGASQALAANNNFTVSGTGEIKHGSRTLTFPAAGMFGAQAGTFTTGINGAITCTSAATMIGAIPLKTGDQITAITAAFSGDGSVDGTFAVSKVSAAGTATSLGSANITNAGSIADTTVDLTDTTLASGEVLIIIITSNAANLLFNNIRVAFNRP